MILEAVTCHRLVSPSKLSRPGISLIFQTDHGEFYYFARRPDEAIAQLQKAIDPDPSFVRAHFLLGRALIQKGRCDEGIDETVKAEKMEPMIYLKVNPIWDPLRSDPRFAERVRRVGLTP